MEAAQKRTSRLMASRASLIIVAVPGLVVVAALISV